MLIRPSLAGMRRAQRFGSLFQAELQPTRHQKSRWLDRVREHSSPQSLCTDRATRDESCARLVHRVDAILPHPIQKQRRCSLGGEQPIRSLDQQAYR